MSKHNKADHEKRDRNSIYAMRFKQRECERCKHKSSRSGMCRVCGGRMK